MEHIQFTDDTYSKKSTRQTRVPDKGIEGWIYKKIPGSPIIKKIVIFLLIIILFAISIIVVLITRKEEKVIEGKANFQERVKATQLN